MSVEKNSAKWLTHADQDFVPRTAAGGMASPEERVAEAVEYLATQMGQINRKLDRLIAAVEEAAKTKETPGSP